MEEQSYPSIEEQSQRIETMIPEVEGSSLSPDTKVFVISLLKSNKVILEELHRQDLKVEEMKKKFSELRTEQRKRKKGQAPLRSQSKIVGLIRKTRLKRRSLPDMVVWV
jgi:hypothetical protein